MKASAKVVRVWSYFSMFFIGAVIAFLFAYIFYRGGSVISWEFVSGNPSGAVLGSEGGIWPAIAGSIWFTVLAVLLAGLPALATALYAVFYCRRSRLLGAVHLVIQSIAGIPSIVLGLFSYSLLVRTLGWNRCLLAGSVALAIMILPFIQVRLEKAMNELPPDLVKASYALGCSRGYTVCHIVLPAIRGELVSAVILGACFAMGATAPLIFTGGVAYAAAPSSVMDPAMALPLHLYLLLAQGTSMPQAYGTAFVLMVIVLVSNAIATFYARRRKGKWKRS